MIMKKNKDNTFMKVFTIILIVVFLIWAIWSWVIVFTWTSSNQETTK